MTPQHIIDTVKSLWDITDTALDATMLDWINRRIWPKVRNVALQSNKQYFNTVEYVNIVADTATYAPEYRIREIHALHIKPSASSKVYWPLSHVELERNEIAQVDNSNSVSVYGYLMEGANIRLVDIPDEDVTQGLRIDYTPQLVVFTLSSTIPLSDDFADVFVEGLALCLAERKKDADIIGHYTQQFAIALKTLTAAIALRVDEPTALESGVPEQLD